MKKHIYFIFFGTLVLSGWTKGYGVSTTEPVSLLPKERILFKDISFKYIIEVFEENHWRILERRDVYIDVVNQRAKIVGIQTPYAIHPNIKPTKITWGYEKGVSVLKYEGIEIDKNLKEKAILKHTGNSAITPGSMGAHFDLMMRLFYHNEDNIPFRLSGANLEKFKLIENNTNSEKITVARENMTYVVDKKDGNIKGFSLYDKPILTAKDLETKPYYDIKITKEKIMDGVVFPLELDCDHMFRYREGNAIKSKAFKQRIIVDGSSIKINKGLSPEDTRVTIPVGYAVLNELTGTTYTADGISDGLYDEDLAAALEQFSQRALENRENSVNNGK